MAAGSVALAKYQSEKRGLSVEERVKVLEDLFAKAESERKIEQKKFRESVAELKSTVIEISGRRTKDLKPRTGTMRAVGD